jgi:hypothetical protein
MRSMLILTLLTALASGCVKSNDSYCDIASPLYFDTSVTIQWLSEHDPSLLREIVIHNEQVQGLCAGY